MESTKIDLSAFDTLLEFLISSPVVPPKFTENIIVDLVFLKAIVMDPPQEFVEDGSLQEAESMVRNVGSFFSLFDHNKMNQFKGLEFCMQLLDVWNSADLPNFERINLEMPKLSPLSYSKTSAFVFINHLLENLEELLKDMASSTLPFNYIILMVQRELRFWYSDLIEISSNPPLFLKEVIETITKLAYDVEYALDLFLVGDLTSWRCICWLNDIFLQFGQIEQEKKTAEDEEEDLKGKKKVIEDMLLGGDDQLDIITIVGMLGIGKRAFAKELYNSPSVIEHFDTRACCCLEDIGYVRRPLFQLLGHLVDLSDIILTKENEELVKLVYECLEGKKFIVVLDKVPSFDEWRILRRCFPDSHNGSRIVLTTEVTEFAFTNKLSKSIVQPQFPQNDIIWEALFHKVSLPTNMLEVGMKIAKRCKPESVTRVLYLLQNFSKTVNQWEQIAQALGSRVYGRAGSQVKRILDLTCFYLPDHLRSCFFYVGVFWDQEKILVSKLIRFWIAEGFVKLTASESLENTAEDYVADLIARNLLVLTEEKTIGGAKTCGLIPFVRDFLSSKVMEDNFLQVKLSSYKDYSSSPTIYYQSRLLLNTPWDEFVMSSGPYVRSLFYFQTDTYNSLDSSQVISRDISFIYNNFKFLRILKVQFINIGESFKEVGVLVLLKYLEVKSSVKFIPPSIANLENLETFLFNQSSDRVVEVPDCICDMAKLRHFHVFPSSSFDLNPHRLENSSYFLDNLQTISRIDLAYGNKMEKMLRKIPSIRKLFCVFLDFWDDATECYRFPMLGFLNQLISLKAYYYGKRNYSCEFNFPSNLKKLTLAGFLMPWNQMFSQLAMLKNLEVLKLRKYDFEFEIWEIEDNVVFPKLKCLKLMSMKDLEYWRATHNQIPHLEHLVVKFCRDLIEIPQDFAYISSLRMIQVYECTDSAENSVRLIQEQHVKHWGHQELKISFED